MPSRQLGKALQHYQLPSNDNDNDSDDDNNDSDDDDDDDDVNERSSNKNRRAVIRRIDALTVLKDGYTSLFSFVKKFSRYFELTTGRFLRYDR